MFEPNVVLTNAIDSRRYHCTFVKSTELHFLSNSEQFAKVLFAREDFSPDKVNLALVVFICCETVYFDEPQNFKRFDQLLEVTKYFPIFFRSVRTKFQHVHATRMCVDPRFSKAYQQPKSEAGN